MEDLEQSKKNARSALKDSQIAPLNYSLNEEEKKEGEFSEVDLHQD